MSDVAYCYHCGTYHPKEEMRQVETKSGKRWRCTKSIQATKACVAQRDAFGKRMTDMNKAEAQAKLRMIKAAVQP